MVIRSIPRGDVLSVLIVNDGDVNIQSNILDKLAPQFHSLEYRSIAQSSTPTTPNTVIIVIERVPPIHNES